MIKYLFLIILIFTKNCYSQSNISSLKTGLNVNAGITQIASISVITPISGGGIRSDTRTFRFRLPSANPECNLPILMAFHGDGGSGAGMEASTGFSTLADAQNFIAVYPDKLSGQSYFSYRIDTPAYLNGQIDETFMLAIIEYLYKNYGINKNRVYATGHSSGAAFVYFLTAKLSNSFAAFAPVAGFPQDYSPSSGVWTSTIANQTTPKLPILHIHGTADNVGGTEYSGTNLPNPYPATPTNRNNGWIWPMFPLSNKSCTNAPGNYTASYFQVGNTTVDKLVFCAAGVLNKEVSMLIVRGMGHVWPNSANTNGVDGSLAIWNFVKDYQLNTALTVTPTITPASITISSGTNTILNASGCGSLNYLWSSGQTTNEINVSPVKTTNYTVSCQSVVSNCQDGNISNTATVTVSGQNCSTPANPSSASATPYDIMAGSTLMASGCAEGTSYRWKQGATIIANSAFEIIYLSSTTTYTAHCVDGACESSGVPVTITVGNPCPTDLVITTAAYPHYKLNQIVNTSETITTQSPPNIIISSTNSNNLTYQAGKSISLSPGFSTATGAVFNAKIEGCIGPQYLKVVGTNIKNKCGTNLLIRGVNFTGYFQYDINNPDECLDRINQIKLTGANTVRLPWLSSTQYGRDHTVLDALMKRITDQKMIVMVDFHDLTCEALTPANIQIATNYWLSPNILAVLKKYENYLLLNIANEVGNDWQGNTATLRQKLIDAYTPSIMSLRNAGLKCPFVIDAPDCGQNAEALVEAAPILLANDPDHNIVFSAHAYWNNDNYTTRLTSAAINAANAGICLIIGEFSVAQDCPLAAQTNDYIAIMQVCNQFNLGYTAWEWGGSRQYGNDGNICPDDNRGVSYSRLTMSGSSGLNADVAGWGIPVRTDILATSIDSCQFNQ